MRYTNFADLPNHIRKRILAVAPSADIEKWVAQQIPALGHRSILDVMNEEGDLAEQKVLQFLLNVEGLFM